MSIPTSPKQAYRARVLAAMPGTQAQIRERTGLGLATVSRWVADLCECKEAHIGGWWINPHGGPVAEILHAGPPIGRKPKRPKVRTDLERTQAYRRRLRDSGEWEHVKAKRRTQYRINNPARDPLTAALFGAA